jgi:hypothetical protein
MGDDEDPTSGALYYANLALVSQGGWFYRVIVSQPAQHPVRGVIGHHTFYA